MLKKIEIWDFESHEHTVIDDLSEGLNLVCGESNSGKTAMVRALRLVAYNEFDPRSVRIGATKCKVSVDTDKGNVTVTRGPKTNLWEVTKNGQPTQYFDKVGKEVVPQAVEVLGMKSVTLGDVSVPVNIMDQLESHFMLAGVGSEKATGSMRAQIVDEISGLSGIEGLIKAVSLDNHRFGREVKEIETKMEETRKQMHDETVLQTESDALGKAEVLLQEHDDSMSVVEVAEKTLSEADAARAESERKLAELDAIPDLDSAASLLEEARGSAEVVSKAESILAEASDAEAKRKGLEAAVAGMPDSEKAQGFLDEAGKDAERALKVERLLDEARALDEERSRLERKSRLLEGVERAVEALGRASGSVERVGRASVVDRDARDARAVVESKTEELGQVEGMLVEAEEELAGILASVTTCPLTLRPVSKECLEGVTK